MCTVLCICRCLHKSVTNLHVCCSHHTVVAGKKTGITRPSVTGPVTTPCYAPPLQTNTCFPTLEPHSGKVDIHDVEGETTKTGASKQVFGEGRAAQEEAGKKGGAISASRAEDQRKESARKAARTRAERYGDKLDVSAPEKDELMEKEDS